MNAPGIGGPPRRLADRTAPLLAAGAYVLAVALAFPFGEVFQFDPDEGTNAIKALLLDHGYPLHARVWSDQPPLLTHLLRAAFNAFGWEIVVGRALVLAFAGLLVAAVYDLARRGGGHVAALLAVALLAASAHFVRLSVSIMVGLPAIALAMLSAAALGRWAEARTARWLVLAGALMGLSLAVKIFTAFLLPVFAVWVAATAFADRRRHGQTARSAALWLGAALGTAAALCLAMVGPAHLDQLYGQHLRAVQLYASDHALLSHYLAADWGLLGLAVAGAIWGTRPVTLLLAAWAGVTLAVLWLHSPLWYHHYLLLTTALCPLAGIAIAGALRPPLPARLPALAARVAVVLCALAVVRADIARGRAPARPGYADPPYSAAALDVMRSYRDQTHTVFADLVMYAFRAGYEVPPELAVISRKLFATGALSAERIAEVVRRDAPTQLVITERLPPDVAEAILNAVGTDYQLVFAPEPGLRIYVRSQPPAKTVATTRGYGSPPPLAHRAPLRQTR